MATRKHVPLTIVRPGVEELHKVSFQASDHEQVNIIPFRYPFADIKNHAALKAAGFFRHENSTAVDTTIGGSATADTRTTLGYKLPRTEKLILLVKVNANLSTDKHIKVTIKGSEQYGIDDVEYVFTQDPDEEPGLEVVSGDLVEIDLYNFGLLLDADGEIQIHTLDDATSNADKAKLSFALIARTG